MVHPLYWVTAITCAIPLALILLHDRKELNIGSKEETAFKKLLVWVLFFCLQDVLWGVCAGTTAWGNAPLFVASTLFHGSTVMTTYFWLNYVLIFLGDDLPRRQFYLGLDMTVIAFQFLMLIVNLFHPVIFSIQDGLYITEFLRPLAFFNQYAVYLLMGILMVVRMHYLPSAAARQKSFTVFLFALAPILTGVFQLLYPDAPVYTIGYFLGIIFIHLFIVQNQRAELQSLHFEMENQENRLKIAEQIALSSTDILTGLPNRRKYEEVVAQTQPDPRLTYLSIDINELKAVNDALGHTAGDELLIGAAECLQHTLGKHGEIYRIGGDEFAALIRTDAPLNALIGELLKVAAGWHGQHVQQLSLSYGSAAWRDHPELPLTELARIADDRMYSFKTNYYLSKGVDRQGMHMAYTALCASYEKILRVDLNHDTFQIIALNGSDIPSYASEQTLSGWLERFGRSGMVHPDDLQEYLRQTARANLQDFFGSGKTHFAVFYRRRQGDGYSRTMMEMIPAEDYAPDTQHLYLYVKNIDRGL